MPKGLPLHVGPDSYSHYNYIDTETRAENLLFDAEGSVKLADFGFSTWWSQEQMLSTWCGSPPYAAPEVFEGRQYVGPEIDIW
ncbi:unnamed protein product, partial [Allacma fusca]